MKNFGLLCGIGAVAFVLAGYQVGLFNSTQVDSANADTAQADLAPMAPEIKPTKKPAQARFPQDLAPAARAEPVPQAAPYDRSGKLHRIAILKTNGALYQDWQDKLSEEWQAETVEDTSLVIVVSPQRRIFLEKIHYPNGAPPIDRYKFEMEATVIEAKTGKALATRLFVNVARNVQPVETWNTTALGSPVEFRTVVSWVTSGARAGFPPVANSAPIVNVVN
jgi:hypothetical protein